MTAPTHAAFGILWAAITGAGYLPALASALGSLLPDLDQPQSSIGRLFFFISNPLNLRFGHRGLIHSFILYLPILICGYVLKQPIILWLALGAISHILIDCYNTSGVKAFLPFSDKTVVLFKRDWRINVGSVQELVVCVIFLVLISTTGYVHAIGGPRKLINLLAHSPQIMLEEFQRAGLKVCHASGKFRWADGRIENADWLIVGNEGKTHLVLWNGERLIRNPKNGEFLSATLQESEAIWPLVHIEGFCTVEQDSFYFDGKKWRFAKKGDVAFGTVKTVDGKIPRIKIDK